MKILRADKVCGGWRAVGCPRGILCRTDLAKDCRHLSKLKYQGGTNHVDCTFGEPKEDYVPFTPGENYVPEYYRQLNESEKVQEADVHDVLHAFGLMDDLLLGEAVVYLFRAGRKPGEPKGKDVSKAMEKLTAWLRFQAA